MKKFILLVITAAFAWAQAPVDRVITCTTTGSANAYVCTPSPAIGAYATGQKLRITTNFANTGAATVAVSGLAATALKKPAGGITTALAANDLRSGQVAEFMFDGTNFVMLSQIGNAPAGGGTIASTTSVLKGDNTGNAVAANSGTDFAPATSGTAILKGSGSGGFANAASGTDYAPATSGTAILKGNNSGGFAAASVGTDYGTPDATAKTFTNTTLDAEGTGNVVTIPVKAWLPAAGGTAAAPYLLWDVLASNAPTAVCSAGTTETTMLRCTADFPDSDGAYSLQQTVALPADWTGAVDARIKYRGTGTTGNVVWQIATACTADAEVDDVAYNTASTVTDAMKGTTNQQNDAAITSITATGCAAGELMHLKVFRDRTNASDTATGVISLMGVELTLRRAM